MKQFTRQQILDLIISLIRDRFETWDDPVPEITRESLLSSDLGYDSLDRFDFAYTLEEQFGVEIPDDDIMTDQLDVLNTYTDYIVEKLTKEGMYMETMS